jgi:hypothetical protein
MICTGQSIHAHAAATAANSRTMATNLGFTAASANERRLD